MSTQVQYRRGTEAQNNAFTGALAEITVDTTNWTLRVHDGITAGGGGNLATVAYVDAEIGGLSANSISDGTSSVTIIATNGNIRANVGGSTVQLLSSGGANVTGFVSATGNVSGSNVTTAGLITATGNITGGNLSGTSIVGTLTTAAQTNITSVGTLTSLAVTGNITSGNLSGTSIVGTLTTAAQTNITSVGTLTSLAVTGNVSGGNLTTAGLVSAGTTVTATGNVTGGNLTTAGQVSATGNVSGGNLNVTGNLVDSGAMSIITGSNGNITLAPNGSGVVVINTDLRNGQANGVGNIGASAAQFNTIFAKATSAQYADVAERYLADQSYAPGTVVEIGGAAEVTATRSWGSTTIAGVISTDPAFIMNSGAQGDHVATVALLGRVPCLVTGRVRRGDLLCSSALDGYAASMPTDQYRPGAVIGKALQDHLEDGTGRIEILVGRL